MHPLLDLGWRRADCLRFLAGHGLADTPKSSCVGCPFHDDGFWLALREHSPQEWADAVTFDRSIRSGSAPANADGHPLRGKFFLHRQRVPLDEVALRLRPRTRPDATVTVARTCAPPWPGWAIPTPTRGGYTQQRWRGGSCCSAGRCRSRPNQGDTANRPWRRHS
ncbi:hypothetical protein [Micromonospora sp. KC721]|uniref:hypothetical protein n=1 Tax=Micromonospora sp. KC721 TaxID=2530380 RepID=UPI001FB756D8|nr:hypothetical protein [Micromonospora sp. KC721]